MKLSLIVLLTLAPSTFATDPAVPTPVAPIRFPVSPAPQPLPPPPPPNTPTSLAPDQLYVIDSDVQLIVVASPANLLTITADTGPVRIRGKFVDGTANETRTYKGKFVYTVEAAGSGNVELIIVPVGSTAASDVIRKQIAANVAPQPPPVPPVPPTPPEPPDPFASAGPPSNRLLIVYESADLGKMNVGQRDVLYSSDFRELVRTKASTDTDGHSAAVRFYDQNVDVTKEGTAWQKAMKLPRAVVPWIVIGNGKTGFSGPLPADLDATTALVNKYWK